MKNKIFVLFLLVIFNRMYSQGLNRLTFCNEPLVNKEVKDFAWDQPVYAKLKVEKPLKNFSHNIPSYELERYNINGVYSRYLKFLCVPEGEDPSQRSNNEITLYLSEAELEKSEIRIDIMPLAKSASTFYGTGFSSELANKNLVRYDVESGTSSGKKTSFTFYLYEKENGVSEGENGIRNNRLITNAGVYIILGTMSMDYSPVTDSREFAAWADQCSAITDSINSKYKK